LKHALFVLAGTAITCGLFAFGIWLAGLQGYREDVGSEPVTTWPWAVLVLGLALVSLAITVRGSRDEE
jgi:O-antigen/teichoic acid export membrane protein